MIKEEYIESLSRLEGLDKESFLKSLVSEPVVSVKLNARKCADPGVLGYGAMERVGWCRNGYYLSERPKFTLNPLLHAGVFYVQDASSMIYETIVENLIKRNLLPNAPVVLDMCAAPGGKTTSIINALPDGSTVVANEVMPKRVQILAENLQKWGYPQIMVTNMQPSGFGSVPEAFDLVAVDAPCSGEGMMRKDADAREQWSQGLVEQCATLQREILDEAIKTLRPGGALIYSTCTFNRRENEENVGWLVEKHGMEPIDPDIDPGWDIPTQIGSQIPSLRFMPHITRGEGLFVAVLRKPGDSRGIPVRKTLDSIRKKGRVILDGIPQTVMKGKIEIPASQSVMATDYPKRKYPEAEVDLDTALRYLRHESIVLGPGLPRDFIVITYQGFPLGLVKNIGNRANNLYPREWRIRNL